MNFKRKLWWAQHRTDVYKYGTILSLVLIVTISIIYFTYSKFSSSNEATMYETTVEPFIKNDYFIASYIDGEWSNEIPGKNDGYAVDKIVCDNGATGIWDNETWSINISNASKKIKCSVYFIENFVYTFDYTGTEQSLTIPQDGVYRLETWGAQGGFHYTSSAIGGYGGYSSGNINLEKGTIIYINVGSTDLKYCDASTGGFCYGGYNGGGRSYYANGERWGSGGGATHISLQSGLLSAQKDNIASLLMVSGGGGGAYYMSNGGSGGGYIGVNGIYTDKYSQAIGGSQTSAGAGTNSGSFGIGGMCQISLNCTGGGAGYYGGGSTFATSSAGGSGYIGNASLTDKVMYCYNCEESSEESTKTVSTTCVEETPTENCAKKGNGYVKITYLG